MNVAAYVACLAYGIVSLFIYTDMYVLVMLIASAVGTAISVGVCLVLTS